VAEVYVEGKKLDVFQGFKFSFNYSIADIRHPEKRSTTYSKTIQCPGTQTNDEIFGQIYDFNISNGYDGTEPNIDVNFNPNKKAEASVQADGVEVMRGSIQLRKIKRKKSDYIYEVVFVGRLVDIFGVLGDKQLSGFEFDETTQTNIPYIDFSDLDHDYTQANQQTSWTAPYGSGYVYPMLDYGKFVGYDSQGWRKYFVTDFKPALYLKDILDRIFTFAGFSYTSSFLSSAFFKRLIVPTQAAKGQEVTELDLRLFKVDKGSFGFQTLQGDPLFCASAPYVSLFPVNNNIGNNSQFLHSTGQFNAPFPVTSNRETVVVCYNNKSLPFFDNNTTAPLGNYQLPQFVESYFPYQFAYHVQPNTAGTYSLLASVELMVEEEYNRDNLPLNVSHDGNITSSTSLDWTGTCRIVRLRNGFRFIVSEESYTFQIGTSRPGYSGGTGISQQTQTLLIEETVNAEAGDIYWVEVNSPDPLGSGYRENFYKHNPDWIYFSSGSVSDYYRCDPYIIGGEFSNTYLNGEALEGESLSINNSLPEVGMSDLLLSVINMFNLYVLPDPNNDLNLLIETRDDFYEAGGVKDWTHKVDHSKELTLEPLALLTANEYEYTYAEDEDYYNERYQDSHGHAYGRARIDIDNDFLNNTNTTEVVFSPTPLVNDNPSNRIIGKIYDSDIEEGAQPTDHNIRVLYYGGLLQSDPKWIHASIIDNWDYPLQYPYAGHLTHPLAPAQDINFGVPNELFYSQNSYTGALLYTNDNLFNRYHRRGLLEATNKDSKMLTAYLYLEPLDIHKLDFRDQIVIDNSYWRINRIMDYNPFSEGLTKVELIKVITKEPLKFESTPIGGGGGVAKPIRPITKRSLKNGNSLPLFGGVVRGTDNTIEDGVTSFMVQGNRNRIKKGSEDITISGDDNTVEGGLRSVRLINTNGVTVTESNVTFVNNRQQESSEVLDGGLDTVRRIGGGSNIFTVDGGLNIVQAQFSETSIYIVEGGQD